MAYLFDLGVAGRSPLTILSYQQALQDLARFLEAAGVHDFTQVSVNELREYLSGLQAAKLKPSTIRTRCTILSCFFNWLLQENAIVVNPMTRIRRPKKPDRHRQAFCIGEIVNIVKAAGSSRNPLRDTAIILLFLDCGLRLSELSALRPNDYDPVTSILLIKGKGSKLRALNMGQRCRRTLEAQLETTNGSVWGIKRGGIRDLIRRLGKKAGTKATPVKFRRTFADRFLAAGGGLDELQYLMGHSSISTTMIYAAAGQEARALRSHADHSPVDRLPLV